MDVFTEQQMFYMQRAVDLGEKGRITAAPNPWVGCVIVKNHTIIGEGFHTQPGMDHAEKVAIDATNVSLKDAEVYVTLEPCNHYGLTPPCTDLLIKHKVRKVFVALRDPDERVSGQGIAKLKASGIKVVEGLEAEKAEASLKPYLHQRRYGSPWVVLKTAVSIEGQVADCHGSSKWLTCKQAREDVGFLRASSQAVIIGKKTALLDNPLLTARKASQQLYDRQPMKIILDTDGNLPNDLNVFLNPERVLYVTSNEISLKNLQKKESLGIEILKVRKDDNGLDLHVIIDYLKKKKFLQVLIEGGRCLHTSFLNKGLANSLIVYQGSKVLGDQGMSMFSDIGRDLSSSLILKLISVDKLGTSTKTVYDFV